MESSPTPPEKLPLMEDVLGWALERVKEEDFARVIQSREHAQVIELRDGRKKYAVTSIPRLSPEESLLVQHVLELFRRSEEHSTLERPSIASFLHRHCGEHKIELEADQRAYVMAVLHAEAHGWGPLTFLLEDALLEEIAVIGIGKEKPVHVYDSLHGWLASNVWFASAECVKNLANKMGRGMGRRLSLQSPHLNAVLENGSRLHAVMEPLAFSGPSLTLRKFKRELVTPVSLLDWKTVSPECLAFLWLALQTSASMVIAGNTGSGKTTTLNALFHFIPLDERIIAVEETPELQLPHTHFVRLNTVDGLGIEMSDLILDTLRMRPDRIIVGEARGPKEVKALWDTLLAGQGKGSYATFHGQSAEEALKRVQAMGVPVQDLSALDLLVVQRRWSAFDFESKSKREVRRIVQVGEILETRKGPAWNSLFEWNASENRLMEAHESARIIPRICEALGLTRSGYTEKWLNLTERLLRYKQSHSMELDWSVF
ncbi:MAG: CpaF family protein [Candidatus Diapherotrites archaeon]|nr:CpaF family protein [Candidatus Diapherotrites archaeon]